MGNTSDDVRIARVNDGQCAHSEKLATGCTKIIVVTRVVMHSSLCQHSIIFHFTFPIVLKYATSIMSVVLSHVRGGALLASIINFALPCRNDFNVDFNPRVYLPLFITSARRELMLSICFFWCEINRVNAVKTEELRAN